MMDTTQAAAQAAQSGGMAVPLLAALIGSVTGVTGAVVGSLTAQSVSRSTRAHALYNAYLERCLQHPELASFNAFKGTYDKRGRATYDPFKFEGIDIERYHWFMGLMLAAMEEILDVKRGDDAWAKTVASQVNYHGGYFEGAWSSLRDFYSTRLQDIVDPLVPEKPDAHS